eukprot:gnl/MRDRNA2_/MRDRNA2_89401_c0_seq1.p1 gnl/MRDRNA2_/MRDRNA2_89401_c0~~gnl/MRDRNA2_/MRDRNA2_89401_c0_seq1.p1  ORF type:complete len:334 (+),score=38.65 gnl/MRDRNA2_/MRDRNA2_89401_c0_seq1:173-1174(+)
MGKILWVLCICSAEAEHRSVNSLRKSSNFIQQKPQISEGSQSQQTHEQSVVAQHLLGVPEDHLSISSAWRHHQHNFYLMHSLQKDSNIIKGGDMDMGEEVDMTIPYNRGLPSEAFDDLTLEFHSSTGSNAIIIAFSDFWRTFMKNLTGSFILGVISLLVTLILGVFYKMYKHNPTSPPEDGEEHSVAALDKREFRYGLCSCSRPSICCMSFCCPAIRWADTIEMSGLMPFWLGLTVCALLVCMSEATFGLTYLLFLLMATHGRQQIRALFGIPGRQTQGAVYDFCIYSCCCCCAIAQEAQQLDEAYAVGHPVVTLTLDTPSIPPIEPGGNMTY